MNTLRNVMASRNRIAFGRCVAIGLLPFALMVMSLTSTSSAGIQGQQPSGKFHRLTNPVPNQYIVVLRDDTPASSVASTASNLALFHGGVLKFVYRYALKGFSVHQMSEAGAIALSNDPRIEFVEEDGIGFVDTTQPITYPGGPWGLDRIDQPDIALDGSLSGTYTYNQTGMGVNVYVLGTGLRTTHDQFEGRAAFKADFVNDGLPMDADCTGSPFPNGHETLVAGIIGGHDFGVAKSVNLYKVRVCDCSYLGQCFDSVVIQGIDWVTGNHVKPAVANMSLHTHNDSNAVDKAVRRSIAAGVVYVASAGNDSQDVDIANRTPARIRQVITVGATGNPTDGANPISDQRASSSNFGSALDLFAPGAQIPSAASTSNTATATDSGTSFAAPHVSGAAALYLQTNTTACPCTVSDTLTTNATQGRVGNPGAYSPNLLLFVPSAWPAPSYRSLLLNGTSAYVDVPNTPSGLGVPIDIAGPITVEAWVKTTSTDRQAIVERYNNSACTGSVDGGYRLLIRPNGNVRFGTLKNACEFVNLDAVATVRDGNWHHIAGVWDGNQMRVYVDGQLKAFQSTSFAPGTGTSHLLIGRSQDGAGFFSGLIDEARVTARALYSGTSFDYLSLKHLTGVVDTKGLWRFDDSLNLGRDCANINNGSPLGGATASTDVP